MSAPSLMSTQHTTGFSGNLELLTEEGPYTLGSVQVLNKPTKIWNGSAFVIGTPRQVTATKAMQFITSEGRVVRCAPTQLVPLADGTSKPAQELKVGDTLARSVMPEYPGQLSQTQSDTFKHGCIYGYALTNTADLVTEQPMIYGIPLPQPYILVPMSLMQRDPKDPSAVPKEVRNPHLVDLGYATKRKTKDGIEAEEDTMRAQAVDFARKIQLTIDHDKEALILLSEKEQTPRTFPNAPVRDRKLWAAGCSFTSHQYQGLVGPRANIAAVATMINSLGPKYEVCVYCVDSLKNKWGIRHFKVAPEQRAPPTVYAVSAFMGDAVMYNIDAAEGVTLDTIMVNGQLMRTASSAPEEK